MKKFIFIPIIAIFHAEINFFLWAYTISIGMRGFDSGEPAPEWASALGSIALIQLQPTFYLMGKFGSKFSGIFPGLMGHIPIFVNSLLWATLYWYLGLYLVKNLNLYKRNRV